MNKKTLYQAAQKHWGEEKQYIALAEECAELIQSCCKLSNDKNYHESFINFIEEIADVEILIEQFREMYGHGIDEIKKEKLIKLADTLNKQGGFDYLLKEGIELPYMK